MNLEISIVIATFNASKTLETCLTSIKSQLTDECELIIIDGGSNDSTVKIIDSYKDIISYSVSERDKGIYDAWNKGILASKGKWIGFIGADDVMNSGAIKKLLEVIHTTPCIDDYDYICAYNQFVDENGRILRRIGSNPTWDKMRKGNCAAHVCSLHNRRNLFEEVGLYDISYKISADYELLVRKKDKLKAYFFEAYIMKMRIGGMSFSVKALKEVYRIRKQHQTVSFVRNVSLYLKDLFAFWFFKLKSYIK